MDDPQRLADLEQDDRFPSGQWTGFFLQYWLPGRHTTELELTFRHGELAGQGEDVIGKFTMAGHYNVRSGECEWVKKYVGRHSIRYKGVNEGAGIWGVWELKQLWGLFTDRGGFHIWPLGSDTADDSDEAEQALLAVMRQQFGNRAIRLIAAAFILLAAIAGAALVAYMLTRQ